MLKEYLLGIRHEDKYLMERRVPLPPIYVKRLIQEEGIDVIVQKSPKRIFTDAEYIEAGAKVCDTLSKCPVIIGVKEIPEDVLEANKTYIFFSHVIKGQAYNMPMLKKLMDLNCTLIDYECIADEAGRRLIFFGRHAGHAGTINSLWSAGQRYLQKGIKTPFADIKQAYTYNSLDEAKQVISEVGFKISKEGLAEELLPFTIGITGYGNVSNGVQDICNLLPIKEITPTELIHLKESKKYVNNLIYKIIFKEEHISAPIDENKGFELHHYYKNPHLYKNIFEKYVPHLSILVNGMYWAPEYPRIITKDFVKSLYENNTCPKLTVIGDITCDPNGSIEITHKGTEIQDPVFVYNPDTGQAQMGFEGKGMLVMAVDILPSELPREASLTFGEMLYKYMAAIVKADINSDFENLNLPNPIKKAVIVYKGNFTEKFKYLEKFVK